MTSTQFLDNPISYLEERDFFERLYLKDDLFGLTTHFFASLESAKDIFIVEREKLSAREGNFGVAEELFGNSLLFLDGDQQKWTRKIYVESLKATEITMHMESAVDIIAMELEELPLGTPIDISKSVRLMVMRLVSLHFLGLDISRDARKLESLVQELALGLFVEAEDYRNDPLFKRGKQARIEIKKLVIRLFGDQPDANATTFMRQLNSLKPSDCFEKSEDFSFDQILTILFAGADTTSSSILWQISVLADNEKLRSQIRTELRDLDLRECAAGGEGLSKAYLAFLLEADRLHPPVYFIPRMATEDVIVGGKQVLKGDVVNFVTIGLHYAEAYFESAPSFAVTRFYEDNPPFRLSKVLKGYGAGPKKCPGEQYSKLLAALITKELLSRYDFYRAVGRDPKEIWIPSWSPKTCDVVIERIESET